MAVTADRVVVELEARLDRYEQRIAHAERHFDRNMSSIQGTAGKTERLVSGAMRGIAASIGAVSVIALARGLLSIADEAKNLDAQLRLATAQTGSFGQATEDVRRIAEGTRSGLSDTAQLYGNFVRNARELGLTQSEAARATETFSKTLKISGAGAAESSAAIRQFSQALASGVLRGDEFNSIMENSPRLARLLADSLGVPVGALRAMAEEGQLTADKLTRALTDTKFTAGIDEEFKQLPVTFDQAMEQVKNAAIITFGAFDRGGEFSTALANFITDGTGGFKDLEQSAVATGIEIRSTFAGLSDAFEPMLTGALSAFGLIGGEARAVRDEIAGLLGSLDSFLNFDTKIENWFARTGRNAANALQRGGVTVPGGLVDRGLRSGREQPLSNMRGRFLSGFDSTAERLRNRGNSVVDLALRTRDEAVKIANAQNAPAPVVGGAKKKTGRKGPSAETLAARAERAAMAEERRQQAFDNELSGLDQDLIDARRALVNAADISAQLEKQTIEAERVRYNDALASQVSQKKLTTAEAEQLRLKNDELATLKTRAIDLDEEERLRKEAVRAARDRVEIEAGDIRNQQDLTAAQLALADTADKRRELEMRLLDLQFEEEKVRLQGLIIANERVQTSKTASDEEKRAAAAAAELARRRLEALPELQAAGREEVSRRNEGPLDQYRRQLVQTTSDIGAALETAAVRGMQRLEDGFVSATKKALGLKGAIGDIIGELIRLAAQQAILAAIGGGNGDSGFLGNIFGFATGGSMVLGGRGGMDTNVLSANGRPIARYSRGESLNIVPQGRNISPVGGRANISRPQMTVISAPQFDMRGVITTPALMAEIDRVSQENATRAAAAMGKGVLKAVPARIDQFQSDGL